MCCLWTSCPLRDSLGLLDALGFGERSVFYEIGIAARLSRADRRRSERMLHLQGGDFRDLGVGAMTIERSTEVDVVERVVGPLGPEPKNAAPRRSVLDPYRAFVIETLERYPRLTSTRIYDMLGERGNAGSLRTLRRFVVVHRPHARGEVYVRIETLLGEQSHIPLGQRGRFRRVGRAGARRDQRGTLHARPPSRLRSARCEGDPSPGRFGGAPALGVRRARGRGYALQMAQGARPQEQDRDLLDAEPTSSSMADMQPLTSAAQILRQLGAESDLVEWAVPFGTDLRAVYERCPFGHHVMWMAKQFGASREDLLRANLAAHFEMTVPADSAAPEAVRAREMAARHERGEASDQELLAALRSASAKLRPDGVQPDPRSGGLISMSAVGGIVPMSMSEEEARERSGRHARILRERLPYDRLPRAPKL